MVIYCDKRHLQIRFGMKMLERALEKSGVFFVARSLFDYAGSTVDGGLITVSYAAQNFRVKSKEELEPEGFEIYIHDNEIHILGADATGAMYGLFEVAEDIGSLGMSAIASKVRVPFMKKRGIKFNLPFEPYAQGDAMEKNIDTCLDVEFWKSYIDFLAVNRYNLLSLWSEHPFHMMFRLEKYPEACPYSDTELSRYQEIFKFIMRRCRERGITVYLITWNIRITDFVAKALGLPPELGDMTAQYDYIYDRPNHLPNPSPFLYAARQNLPVIKDYMKECIRTLILTYHDLGGIGTNCAEEMSGDAYERQQWVMDSYLEGIKEAGREIPFVMRTNMGNGKVAMAFMEKYPFREKYVSWKYSNAHMYSSTNPKFEDLWNAWDGVDMTNVRVMFTVRNDDINTFRWADSEFIREYIRGAKKDYVEGFYWGADAYMWASDFQAVPETVWRYDFEKHWSQFWLLGRLGYHIDEPESRFLAEFSRYYGKWSRGIHLLLSASSKIIPAVNRLLWINYDFQWHPESLLSVTGFRSVVDFVNSSAMPGVGTISIPDYAEAKHSSAVPEGETPEDILKILEKNIDILVEGIPALEKEIPREYMADELGSTLIDLHCWKHLGIYYYYKISAAVELALYRRDGKSEHKEKAVLFLEKGREHYRKLSFNWSRQYMPYMMARTRRMFGYSYYYADVEKDIELARNFE